MDFTRDILTLRPASPDLSTAQPHFAVALSFFNDLHEPVFKRFESGNEEGAFATEMHIVSVSTERAFEAGGLR